MISPPKQKVTLEEFDAFVNHPDNVDKAFEWINRQVFEKTSSFYASKLAAKILILIGLYLLENDIGHVTGADGGYVIGVERYAPDVAYISYEKQPELAKSGYNPTPPDLAVEVISNPSSSTEQNKLRLKLTSYLSSGVTVWVVNSESRQVEVHQVGVVATVFNETETISGGDMLPGFEVAVKDIFPKQGN